MMMEMLLLTQVAEIDLILMCAIWLVVGLAAVVLFILLLSPDTLSMIASPDTSSMIAAEVLRRPLLMIRDAGRHTALKHSLFPMGARESKLITDAVKYVRTATWPHDVYEEDSSQTEPVVSETGEMVTRNKRVLVHKKGDPKFPFLNTLSDKALVTALFMPDDELEADVKVFVKIDTHGLSREEAERKKKNFCMGVIEDCRLARRDMRYIHMPYWRVHSSANRLGALYKHRYLKRLFGGGLVK